MPVLIWSEHDGALANSIRTGRRVSLSAEEFRHEAEALDRALDDLLDMAWHALTIITKREQGKLIFDSFEQAWVLGRAVFVSEILRHPAMQGEERVYLWQALTPKAFYGVRSDLQREPRWRDLLAKGQKWKKQPRQTSAYRIQELGYWLREQQLQDAGEVFGWNYSNAQALHDRTSLRSFELRQAMLNWLRMQAPDVREQFAKKNDAWFFAKAARALYGRFPARGPGSALLPQHYPPAELQAIVNATLDEARDAHFGQAGD